MKKLLFFILLASLIDISTAKADEQADQISELIAKLQQDSDALHLDQKQLNQIQNPQDRIPFIEKQKKDQAIFDADKAKLDKLRKPKKNSLF